MSQKLQFAIVTIVKPTLIIKSLLINQLMLVVMMDTLEGSGTQVSPTIHGAISFPHLTTLEVLTLAKIGIQTVKLYGMITVRLQREH